MNETIETRSQRWVPVCQDCWQELNPDQYCPDLTGYETCGRCGQESLTVNVHPDLLKGDQARRD